MQSIHVDGFDEMPGLRNDLLAFIDEFCDQMTLAQAKEWYDDAFANVPHRRP